MEYFPQIRLCLCPKFCGILFYLNVVEYSEIFWDTLRKFGTGAIVSLWGKVIPRKPDLDFHFELWVHIMESGYLYRGGKMCDTQEKSSDTGLPACLLSLSYFPDTLHEGWDRVK